MTALEFNDLDFYSPPHPSLPSPPPSTPTYALWLCEMRVRNAGQCNTSETTLAGIKFSQREEPFSCFGVFACFPWIVALCRLHHGNELFPLKTRNGANQGKCKAQANKASLSHRTLFSPNTTTSSETSKHTHVAISYFWHLEVSLALHNITKKKVGTCT
jgi:hypothetical protein